MNQFIGSSLVTKHVIVVQLTSADIGSTGEYIAFDANDPSKKVNGFSPEQVVYEFMLKHNAGVHISLVTR